MQTFSGRSPEGLLGWEYSPIPSDHPTEGQDSAGSLPDSPTLHSSAPRRSPPHSHTQMPRHTAVRR
eukprot:6162693-Alexandrium_andersonii.AAC.1